MLKDYLNQIGKSIYAVSKETGIPYSTLNDLANGKVQIDQCRVGLLRSLARTLGMSLEETCGVCAGTEKTVPTSYHVDVQVFVRNKSYYLKFDYEGEPVLIELCKVNKNTRFYIEDIAAWRAEEYIRNRRMREFR